MFREQLKALTVDIEIDILVIMRFIYGTLIYKNVKQKRVLIVIGT